MEQLLPARQLREGTEWGAHRQQEWSPLTRPARLAVTFLLECDCGKSGDGVEVLSGGLSEARFWQSSFSLIRCCYVHLHQTVKDASF